MSTIKRIKEITYELSGKGRGNYSGAISELIEIGGIKALERAVTFVNNASCEYYYSTPAAPRIMSLTEDWATLDQCERLSQDMYNQLKQYNELQKSGDLLSVIGSFVTSYPLIHENGQEFIEQKVNHYIKSVREDDFLCVGCGRDFFEKLLDVDFFLDHSKFGLPGDRKWNKVRDYLRYVRESKRKE